MMKKIGFHYYRDTDHFQQKDIKRWLPELESLDAYWLLLTAPFSRAIPDYFLRSLVESGIKPVLQFHPDSSRIPQREDFQLLFETYARWGVEHVIFYDRPNVREFWGMASWSKSDLVERFLDHFIPLAEEALQWGLRPVFPPLEPGGDYWDTMFLRASLDGLRRRGSKLLLKRLVLSACANSQGRHLNWGAGGPERWPEAHPYDTAEDSEDHRGFRIADWYLTISEAILDERLPVIMLDLGGESPADDESMQREITMVELLQEREQVQFEALPEQILCGMFQLVDGGGEQAEAPRGWFHEPGKPRPVVQSYQELNGKPTSKERKRFRLKHYLLLPTYEWGIADWHLEVTRSYIKRYQPTIGFSLQEAIRAEEVTVVGGEEHFSEEDLNQLRARGSVVRRVEGDGTEIAAQLAAM